MKLKVTAPTRMDLSGGTLDIYPLYLFEEGGLTLNAAIDLGSEVEVEAREDERIRIEAVDLDRVEEVPHLDALECEGEHAPLDLIIRILRFYRPTPGLTVRVRSHVPPGSGLGGSSSLLISLSTALVQLENRPLTRDEIIDLGASIEAQSIRIPTGKQDYFPPAFGGFNALWFDIEGVRREPLLFTPAFQHRLQTQLILGYCGASRFSGANNWTMMKRYIEGEGATVAGLRQIKKTAQAMYHALRAEDLKAFGDCLADEWETRKGLAEGVSTPQLEGIFRAASQAGALASKVCGAGGGGCFITLAREGQQAAVRSAVEGAGGRVLDYRFSTTGVRVEDP